MDPSFKDRVIVTLNACVGWCTERRIVRRALPPAILLGIIGGLFYALVFAAPSAFQGPQLVVIKRGTTLAEVAEELKTENVIRSAFLFTALSVLFKGDDGVVAGSYFFPDGQNIFTVASRFTSGDYRLESVKVTIPEGTTRKEIGVILSGRLGVFDAEEFMRITEGKEGFLFPDTYFFLPGEDPMVVAHAMETNFCEQIKAIEIEIQKFGKPLHDVVTMASLLEEEARKLPTRRMIAGILWKRIEIGMRLQVDAVFSYILGKNTFQLSLDDLSIDSPYNTYRYAGLPLGPITNPGLASLTAAVTPTKSSYLYYLSDTSGRMHYSRTHDEHVRKKELYLGS